MLVTCQLRGAINPSWRRVWVCFGALRRLVLGLVCVGVWLSAGAEPIRARYEALLARGKTEEAKVADIIARMNDNSYKVPTGDVVSGIMSGIPTHI